MTSAATTSASHTLTASPENVHWGYFDAKLKPHLTIESGETVTLNCVSGGPGEVGHRTDLLPEHRAILEKVKPYLGPHILTGPVAVRGAKAGQVLEVRIKSIDLHYDWGYNMIRPLTGALPDDFKEMRLIHIPLDRARMVGTMSLAESTTPRCWQIKGAARCIIRGSVSQTAAFSATPK